MSALEGDSYGRQGHKSQAPMPHCISASYGIGLSMCAWHYFHKPASHRLGSASLLLVLLLDLQHGTRCMRTISVTLDFEIIEPKNLSPA